MKSIADSLRPPGPSPRALVVEHHAGMRVFVAGVARAVGLDVLEAASGEAAIEAISREDFDLLITDLVLPAIDGYAVIASIQDLPKGRGRPRVIVCSSLVNTGGALRQGELDDVDVLLPLPTTAVDLIEAIRKALAQQAS